MHTLQEAMLIETKKPAPMYADIAAGSSQYAWRVVRHAGARVLVNYSGVEAPRTKPIPHFTWCAVSARR